MRSLLLAVFAFSVAVHSAEFKKLVIIGDSLSEGYGVSHESAYPSLLEKEIAKSGKSWKVVNAGISGSTSASAFSQVQWHMKQKPDLMIIQRRPEYHIQNFQMITKGSDDVFSDL